MNVCILKNPTLVFIWFHRWLVQCACSLEGCFNKSYTHPTHTHTLKLTNYILSGWMGRSQKEKCIHTSYTTQKWRELKKIFKRHYTFYNVYIYIYISFFISSNIHNEELVCQHFGTDWFGTKNETLSEPSIYPNLCLCNFILYTHRKTKKKLLTVFSTCR